MTTNTKHVKEEDGKSCTDRTTIVKRINPVGLRSEAYDHGKPISPQPKVFVLKNDSSFVLCCYDAHHAGSAMPRYTFLMPLQNGNILKIVR